MRNIRLLLKRTLRIAKVSLIVFLVIVLAPVVVGLGRAAIECRIVGGGTPAEPSAQGATATPPETAQIRQTLDGYSRNEDQTYLTLPEWYIVYSADEYAAFIATNRPSQFPYFRAIGQFWQSYYDVCAVTREQYPYNGGYHLSLAVIGSSFTVENSIRGLYENTFGRMTESISSDQLTDEDAYAREVAAEYGQFLHTIPWYEFPFGEKVRGVWNEPWWGPNVIRKWERKAALTVEYGSKAAYGWLIKQGTQSVYSAEELQIHVAAEGLSDQILQREAEVRVVRPLSDGASIVTIPRYEAFTQIVPRLVKQGVRFTDIAGNDEILVTLLAPVQWQYSGAEGDVLFSMPILTQPDTKRVAMNVQVSVLHRVLASLSETNIQIEHIYDY